MPGREPAVEQSLVAQASDGEPIELDEARVLVQRPPDRVVLALDDGLGPVDLGPHPRIGEGTRPGGVDEALREKLPHAVALEERILETDEEPRGTGLALPPRSPAQLVVDPAALVPVGADDVQAPQRE